MLRSVTARMLRQCQSSHMPRQVCRCIQKSLLIRLVILVFLLEVCWGLLEVVFVQDLDPLQKIQKHRKTATTHFIHEVVARFLTKCASIDCWSCVDLCISKWICQLYLVALAVEMAFNLTLRLLRRCCWFDFWWIADASNYQSGN